MRASDRPGLALYLALAWAGLVVYASLYPFTGWRDTGVNPLAFLGGAWPRYFTWFDVLTNVAAYAPLGFAWCLALRRHRDRPAAPLLAAVIGLVLSGALEMAQNYLPSRVASNLDLACNATGALVGAVAAMRWGGVALAGGRLPDLGQRLFAPRRGVDAGLVLLAMWLVTQLDPALLPFGAGDLRRPLDLPGAQHFAVERFQEIETAIAATGLLAGLTIAGLMTVARHRHGFVAGVLLAALGIKTLAHALLMGPQRAFAWATPGVLLGIAVGLMLWLLASYTVTRVQRAVAALALLMATAMVNIAPLNPYLDHTLQVWNPGQFLHFHGLTQFVGSLWPFLALPWLMLLSSED